VGEALSVSAELGRVLALGAGIERDFARAFRLMPECACAETCYAIDGFSEMGALDEGVSVRRLSAACAFDLGGIAKGAVVDGVADLFARLAPESEWVVNAGGDLRCSSEERVELRIPGESNEARFELTVAGGAVATSSLAGDRLEVGTPSARWSEFGGRASAQADTNSAGAGAPVSATVIAECCAVADALTKVALFGALASQEQASPRLRALGASSVHLFDGKGRVLA
jgi:thiamine biosynthesis lipoprotein ApbE